MSGFTLIEAIGVMAIISVLVTVASTTAISTLRIKQRDVERGSLETLAEALPAHIRRTRTIPSSTNWARELISELTLPAARIASTPVGNNRVLVFDPAAQIAPLGGASGLPYVQTTGAAEPSNLRLVVVSSVGLPLPSLAGVSFDNLWNSIAGQVPTGFPAWKGHPDDLRIQRLELGNLFHRVILNNLDRTNQAVWSVDGAASLQTLDPESRREMWIIDTSAMSFYEPGPHMTFREVIRKDVSYTFESGRWYPHVLNGGVASANACGPFAELVQQFLAAPVRPEATEANPQAVVSSMFNYMNTYKDWSKRGRCSNNDSRWYPHRRQLSGHCGGCSDACSRLE